MCCELVEDYFARVGVPGIQFFNSRFLHFTVAVVTVNQYEWSVNVKWHIFLPNLSKKHFIIFIFRYDAVSLQILSGFLHNLRPGSKIINTFSFVILNTMNGILTHVSSELWDEEIYFINLLVTRYRLHYYMMLTACIYLLMPLSSPRQI